MQKLRLIFMRTPAFALPLLAGDTEPGVCMKQMDEGRDTGGVLMKEHFPIPAAMNAGELHDILAGLGANLVLKTLMLLPAGGIKAVPQSAEGVTHAPKIT